MKKIIQVLNRTQSARIAVFGDYTLDKYLYIDPRRDEPSVETGLVAYQIHEKRCFAGSAGTVTNNLRALGAQVVCVGLVGDDGEGYELLNCLIEQDADVSHMIQSDQICTCTYQKPMRRQTDGTYQEMSRLDFRNFTPTSLKLSGELLHQLEQVLPTVDAVLVVDQFVQRNLGAVTDEIRESLGQMAKENPDVIFYVDSRGFAAEYRNMIVKCNNLELMALGGTAGDPEDIQQLQARMQRLGRESGNRFFVTRGEKGILVLEDGHICAIPAYPVRGPIDVVGAGDASSAGIVLGLTLGLRPYEAAVMACCISSVTIEQIGCTGTATVQQLKQRLNEYENEGKV